MKLNKKQRTGAFLLCVNGVTVLGLLAMALVYFYHITKDENEEIAKWIEKETGIIGGDDKKGRLEKGVEKGKILEKNHIILSLSLSPIPSPT